MKLYIAGPMRGYPKYNFPAFFHAAQVLRAEGHAVFNPAERDVTEDGFDPEKDEPKSFRYYMQRDLPAVMDSDALVMLPGWRKSKGGRLESHVATECGLPLLNLSLEPIKETVLEEAERIVGGDRNDAYGHPAVDFACIAAMWNAYLIKRFGCGDLTSRDVAMLMIMLKTAREARKPGRDNLVDIAGYARCAERLDEVQTDNTTASDPGSIH